MGFCISVQHRASPICLPRLLQSSSVLLPTTQKHFIKRRKFGNVCNLNATTHGKGAYGEKSNFVKPKWLLPLQEEALVTTEKESSITSLYQVILTTSKDYGSGISDLNAGILLAFIGEEGRCSVHRISNLISSHIVETSENPQELCESSHTLYRFQRGAQDVVTILGPDLGRLEAVWVAPQRGRWRLQGIIVRVFPNPPNETHEQIIGSSGSKNFQYNFELEETLIGENEFTSAAEFLVTSVDEISNEIRHANVTKSASQSHTSLIQIRDKGLKEYEALKFSLLSYDALLVIAGGAMFAVLGHIEVTKGYLIGGISGFLYLFFLGKAVDQLPAPSNTALMSSNSETNGGETTAENNLDAVHTRKRESPQFIQSFKTFRAPLTRVSGVLVVCVVILKAIIPTNTQVITKEMLFAGAAGFLMTKLATVLASNIPLQLKQAHSSQRKA